MDFLEKFLQNITLDEDTWIVVRDLNISADREIVYKPRRMSVILFGALLAIWAIFCNLFVCSVVGRGLAVGKHSLKSRPTCWMILNHAVSQLFIATLIIPLNVKTENDGLWTLGPSLCRTWLLAQIFAVSHTMWSLFVFTLDRLYYALGPKRYVSKMTGKKTAIMVGCTWIISAITVIPPGVAMRDPDFVFEEVCALEMTIRTSLAISLAAFFVPAALLLLATCSVIWVALGHKMRDAAMRYRMRRGGNYGDIGNNELEENLSPPNKNMDEFVDTNSVCNAGLTVMIVNLMTVMMWAPFYVTNVLVANCHAMCVDPALWSVFVWLGYTSAGVLPAVWFVSREVRYGLKVCVQRESVVDSNSLPDGRHASIRHVHTTSDEVGFRPYLFMKTNST